MSARWLQVAFLWWAMKKLWVSSSSCLAQLQFWKQLALERCSLYRGPLSSCCLSSAPCVSSSPSCQFPFRPVFLASLLTISQMQGLLESQNVPAGQGLWVYETNPISYTWEHEGSERSHGCAVAKIRTEPGSKPSVLLHIHWAFQTLYFPVQWDFITENPICPGFSWDS